MYRICACCSGIIRKDYPPISSHSYGPLLGCAKLQEFHLEVGDESARQVPSGFDLENIGISP